MSHLNGRTQMLHELRLFCFCWICSHFAYCFNEPQPSRGALTSTWVTNSHWCCVSECIQTRIWLKIIFLYELSITFNRLIDFNKKISCSNSECMESFQAFVFFVLQDFSKDSRRSFLFFFFLKKSICFNSSVFCAAMCVIIS